MKTQDFTLTDQAAWKLHEIDTLVDEGIARPKAEELVQSVMDLIDGPWSDFLADFSNPENSPERTFLQTSFISYLSDWVDERITLAGISQGFAIRALATEKPNG